MSKILAFETSCDDTSVSIIDENYNVYINLISSQPIHNKYGGVVPELASRMHIKNIMQLTALAFEKTGILMSEIDAVAVSINPGLIGSLLVGISFAKAFSYSIKKPLIAVNHMLGHVYANKIENPELEPPFVGLVVSGGHTELVDFRSFKDFSIIGNTRDDAAGEAFDKLAKLLGLGYPGGPIIDKLAKTGNPEFVRFPRALNRKDNFDFSFSGFKTAVRNYLEKNDKTFIDTNINNICASLQVAIVDSLASKSVNYIRKNKKKTLVVAGGVSANSALRKRLLNDAQKYGFKVFFPPLKYCMDNAAMIGAAAIEKFANKDFADLDLNAFSKKGIRFL